VVGMSDTPGVLLKDNQLASVPWAMLGNGHRL
jgi:hypothetical protein